VNLNPNHSWALHPPLPLPHSRPCLQCWAPSRTCLLTRAPPSFNNSLNLLSHNNPRTDHLMFLLHPSTAKTSPSQMCFIFFNLNGENMNVIAMSGRLSVLRCEFVVCSQRDVGLHFHTLSSSQARIALLEGERRSFENIKVDLMRRIKMLEYALRVERCVPIPSLALSTDVTCFTRAARNNSHNRPLSDPNRYPPQRSPLCSPLLRRTRRLAIRMVAVPALLAVKVSPIPLHPFLLLTRPKTLPYLQKGVPTVPRSLVQRERVRWQGHHHRLGGRTPMALPQLLPWVNHRLVVTPRAGPAVGSTLNSTRLG
jgi:hypothetical protein